MPVTIDRGDGVCHPADPGTTSAANGKLDSIRCHQIVGLGVDQATAATQHQSVARVGQRPIKGCLGGHRRSRSLHSAQEFRDLIPPLAPLIPNTSSGPASPRLQHAAAAAIAKESPTVPVRPPLRPSISFGGETRYSYYSTLESPSLADKPVAMVAKKSNIGQQDRHKVTSPCDLGFSNLLAMDLALSPIEALWTIIGFVLAVAVGPTY